MKVRVCLVCPKAIDSDLLREKEEDDIGEKCENVSVLTRFLKFAEKYLQLSTAATKPLFRFNGGDKEGDHFCEKCELAIINPICQVYLELVSNQLRLSWELGQLGKLLENSQRLTSDNLRGMSMQALTNQLGMENVAQLEKFRSLLMEKCKLIICL